MLSLIILLEHLPSNLHQIPQQYLLLEPRIRPPRGLNHILHPLNNLQINIILHINIPFLIHLRLLIPLLPLLLPFKFRVHHLLLPFTHQIIYNSYEFQIIEIGKEQSGYPPSGVHRDREIESQSVQERGKRDPDRLPPHPWLHSVVINVQDRKCQAQEGRRVSARQAT